MSKGFLNIYSCSLSAGTISIAGGSSSVRVGAILRHQESDGLTSCSFSTNFKAYMLGCTVL